MTISIPHDLQPAQDSPTVIFGLGVATLMTLLVVPGLWSFKEDLAVRLEERKEARKNGGESGDATVRGSV